MKNKLEKVSSCKINWYEYSKRTKKSYTLPWVFYYSTVMLAGYITILLGISLKYLFTLLN